MAALPLKPSSWIKLAKVKRRLKHTDPICIQLGSGQNLFSGWINVDSHTDADLELDMRGPLPFKENQVQYIYTEHFLDHLDYPNGVRNTLRECHRVLKQGGIIRIVVHDADRILRAYVTHDDEFFLSAGLIDQNEHEPPSRIEAVNHIFRFNGFHQFIFDFETLQGALLQAGFRSVIRSACNQSAHLELNRDRDTKDRFVQSLYIEAEK